MSRSINRTEGYEVVAMPVGGGETESIGGAKERVGSAAKSRSIFGGEVVGAAKDQVTPTPKSRSVSKLGLGGEFISAVKEQFTPTPKNKNVSKLSLGGELIGAAKEQLFYPPKNNVSKLSFGDETISAAKEQPASTTKNKNGGVGQDWEVVELGPSTSTELTIPHRPSIPRESVIDLEDYEYDRIPMCGGVRSGNFTGLSIESSDSEEGEFEFEIISSHTIAPPPSRRRSTIYPLRNPPIQHPLYSITATTISNVALSPATVVELSDGDFLKITDLIRNVDTGVVTLRGHRFQRTRDLNGLLAKKRNELCWVTELDEDDDRPASVQSLAEVPASSVIRRRDALITNMSFPAATFRNTPHPGDLANVENDGLVTVRWSYTTTWPSAKARINNENAICERVLRHLGEGDALVGEGLRIRDELAREQFRGPTVRGGSYIPVVRIGGNMSVKKGREAKVPVLGGETGGWLRRLAGSRSGSVQEVDGKVETTGCFDDDMVDLTDEFPKTGTRSRASSTGTIEELFPSEIDLTMPFSSLLPSGAVRATNAASKKKATIKRVPGQMYTYGDACESTHPPSPPQPTPH